MKRLIFAFALLFVTAGVLAGCARSDEPAASAENPSGAIETPVTTADLPVVTVYKTPTCGCCEGWVEHLEATGFQVKTVNVNNLTDIKREHGVPTSLTSCHTGVVDGYVVEGHVPAEDVKRLLAERPAGVAGIAVGGMPIGSPGMEGPNPQPYEVIAFGPEGNDVFAQHRP